ncbi:MAG: hypothetical protein Q9192_007012, partial [Flavoplaca navasiana]
LLYLIIPLNVSDCSNIPLVDFDSFSSFQALSSSSPFLILLSNPLDVNLLFPLPMILLLSSDIRFFHCDRYTFEPGQTVLAIRYKTGSRNTTRHTP